MKTTLLIVLTIFHQLSSSTAIKDDPSIIIIGAGISGLAAGKNLLDHGFHNLTILEAENRIGGRIHSVFFGDAFIDLGAAFCHGQSGNIVYNTVENLNLLENFNNFSTIYSSSGEEVDPEFADEFFNITGTLYARDDDFQSAQDPGNMSFGEYFTKYYTEMINERFADDPVKLKLAHDGLELLEKWAESSDGYFSWFDGPASTDYEFNEGDDNMEWKGNGYQTFINVLLEKFPDLQRVTALERRILFEKEVVKIAYDSSREWGGVTVTCSDGSVYVADHVIVTVSLGVIKENLDKMFEPQLPLTKTTAIDNIGFGAIVSLAAHYTDNWWDDGDNFLGASLLWTKEDLDNSAKEFPSGPHHNNRSWVTYAPEIIPSSRNPNVLRLWFNGVLVPDIELLSDEVLVDGLYFITKKFLGKEYNVSKPDKIIQWVSNPHFRGTYSYQKFGAVRKGNGTNAEEELAEPMKTASGRPFVHFAGEATHSKYYSNVQGATESGIREAQTIINYYSNQ